MAEKSDNLSGDSDRRRNPRFSCGGTANIVCLPSDGILIPGTLRDLSLGGCKVQMLQPPAHGVVAEIMVRIGGTSFRALGRVRELPRASGVGMQFLCLSSGGNQMLEELVRELARRRQLAQVIRAARREPATESPDVKHILSLSSNHIPILGRPEAADAPPVNMVDEDATIVLHGEIDLLV